MSIFREGGKILINRTVISAKITPIIVTVFEARSLPNSATLKASK